MARRVYGALAAVFAIAAVVAVAQVFSSSGATKRPFFHVSKQARAESSDESPGEGPIGSLDAYLEYQHAYPATDVPPAVADRAEQTFNGIAAKDNQNGNSQGKSQWQQYGPLVHGTEPGVLAFSGATNNTASRTTALAVAPDCGSAKKNAAPCRVWMGAAGGGVWETDDALAADPSWTQVSPDQLDQNSVGVLTLDPTDKQGDTLYLGTGEPNRCTSGCEAGVGIYTSNNGGKNWKHLKAACVSNATYPCATPGADSFLGRGITSIVLDPNDSKHLYVGSTLAVRGLSHVIGAGGTSRLEPGSNAPGVYESTDAGKTFTMIWNGNAATLPAPNGSFGITNLELDPLDPSVIYASAFDVGLWRRDAGASTFSQVFAPQFVPPTCGNPAQGPAACGFAGTDRTSFDLTVKNGHTRIYLTDGTANPGNSTNAMASNFWRIDNANQPAATLLASQAAGATAPAAPGNPFPATYNGWQNLTANVTASPYYPAIDFCTGQCWYDETVYTPAGLPDTVYLLGSYNYGEVPCNTTGVGCGNGRSNGRAVIYSTTAGDPDASAGGRAVNRTFTDLTFASTTENTPWCALGNPGGANPGGVAPANQCTWAAQSIHPDQHVIAVNPSNPTQIFEGSDGGLVRTSGAFADISSRCNSAERPLLGAASLTNCGRLLSRVPTAIDHIDTNYSSTLQYINVAINPLSTCEVMGGTQDNGTWSNNSGCDNNTWNQVIYGDGGNAGYDKSTAWRFNEFTSGASDSNFENGDPTKWVITSAPIVNSGEGAAFYWPQISDPNPPAGTHPIFSGAKHVWRSWAFGAGTPRAVPQDSSPNIAGYEASCQEFTVSAAAPACGDYQPLGGPYCQSQTAQPQPPVGPACINQPGDLTGTAYGPAGDRSGGAISFLARTSADHGTLWAATGAGRLFVTHNADAANPANVTWHRIDNATSPTRYPSGITIDPSDPTHAWVSYSGYNANTPTTPGHVFDVHENGTAPGSGTFRNLDIESATNQFPTPASDGDLPVADIVRDDATQTLYAATDFGVLRGDNDGTSWHVTQGMPRYEVMHLELQPSSRVPTCSGGSCPRVLYAATHSQGIWRLDLGSGSGNNGNGNGNGNGNKTK